MGMTVSALRLKSARYLVWGLWLHAALVFSLAYLTQTDPVAPTAMVLFLAALATAVGPRARLAPLGAVLVSLAFGGGVFVVTGLIEATPWQGVTPIYIATAMALTLPLCSGAAVLAFASLALLPSLALPDLLLARLAPQPQETAGLALLAVQTGAFAALAQGLARALHSAQAKASAAQEEAEGLWQARITAQIVQSQAIAALVDRLTALAQNPVNPAPSQTALPFDYAELEQAFDLLAQKLQRGGGLTDLSGFAAFAQIDLAAAACHLADSLHDQAARLGAISQAARGDYRAKVLHQMRLDLADLTDQTRQTCAFAAEISRLAEGYIKIPVFARTAVESLTPAAGQTLQKPPALQPYDHARAA